MFVILLVKLKSFKHMPQYTEIYVLWGSEF
jgi:hypothetical protein